MMETSEKFPMSCEQAASLILDLDRQEAISANERAAAITHLSGCSRCAALQESWEAARGELRILSVKTRDVQAPPRVKMRLLQEFRLRHRRTLVRRASLVGAWTLAAAAALVAGLALWSALHTHRPVDDKQDLSAKAAAAPAPAGLQTPESAELSAATSGADDSSDFTPLPGTLSGDTDEAAILRVRMQRGSLGALGFPVNEQRAGEWIQVDLLVGTDGSPQAVRLAEEDN